MRELEIMAQEARAVGVAVEFVALGFVEPEGRYIRWYALTNETVDAEFHVSGEQLTAVVADALDRGMMQWRRVLWHSHPHTPEPSAYDVAEFPSWLADEGRVYFAETDTTIVYNSGGVIHPRTGAVSPRVSQEA